MFNFVFLLSFEQIHWEVKISFIFTLLNQIRYLDSGWNRIFQFFNQFKFFFIFK
ncbi:unnamed protein product [Meloidogyne enterolobii]|uniref:Uncharacterized protein n=1 Tax=Meloidogyne enterolobii TaxID=390850 RepID=A0ACB0ZVL1_MELEN